MVQDGRHAWAAFIICSPDGFDERLVEVRNRSRALDVTQLRGLARGRLLFTVEQRRRTLVIVLNAKREWPNKMAQRRGRPTGLAALRSEQVMPKGASHLPVQVCRGVTSGRDGVGVVPLSILTLNVEKRRWLQRVSVCYA